MRNWKRRHFFITNASDNFVVAYAEDNAALNIKGSFTCAGYFVKPFAEDEISTSGRHGFKLCPYDDSKRTWWLRADNNEEYEEWLEAFTLACRKSTSLSADKHISHAFLIAYRNTRASYGYFGKWRETGNEKELLEILLKNILKRELVDDSAIVPLTTSGKSNGETNAEALFSKLVGPTIASTWKDSHVTAEIMKTKFMESLKPSFREYISTEDFIIEQFQARIGTVAAPVLADSESQVIKPILESILDGIVKAYTEAIQGIYQALQPSLKEVSMRPESLLAVMNVIDVAVQSMHTGPLQSAQRTIYNTIINGLQPFQDALTSAGVNVFDVYLDWMDSIRQLVRNAAFTFVSLCLASMNLTESMTDGVSSPLVNLRKSLVLLPRDNLVNNLTAQDIQEWHSKHAIEGISVFVTDPSESSMSQDGTEDTLTANILGYLKESVARLTLDAKEEIKETLSVFLLNVIEATVQELVILPCSELAYQVANKIPKNLVGIVNINGIVDRYIRLVAKQHVLSSIQPSEDEISSHLDHRLKSIFTP